MDKCNELASSSAFLNFGSFQHFSISEVSTPRRGDLCVYIPSFLCSSNQSVFSVVLSSA